MADIDDSVDGDGNVVDSNVDRMIDRLVNGAGGTVSGNAMVGMAKGMGLHKEPEEAAEIREIGPPDDDPDDPIEIRIDADDPTKSRILFHLRADDGPDAN